MMAPDYGSPIFAAWRGSAGKDWATYTHHRFVSGLGDGSLPRKVFLRYLTQDFLFLVHFSRAWALAVVKSETIGEMRVASAVVDALVNHEIQLHIKTCAEEGLDEAALFAAAEAEQNVAYTRYVLDAGISGDLLDMLAALAPCVFGYGEIGLRLAETATSDTYRAWIDTYSGAEYQEVCTSVASLIESAAASRIGDMPQNSPRWPRLCERFGVATRLEAGFWEMGFEGEA